ncbi:hypothetical protein HHL22_07140 [Hymenobacter sp. RP-2-7]|uniref:Uncharacterized protein n=1 Tax=Hymenobacter polaris TaxID=2682546 RepID=A0A7Y0FLN1_9BACT|nr:hypothetical protein [Hymenobacter polaris]NML64978.1 hypothetical protein [Hymenobacter polaris]
MNRTLHLLLAGAVWLAAPAARAQDIGPALDMTLMTGWAGNAAVTYDLEKRAGMHKETAGSSSKATAARVVRLTYTSTPALRQQTVQRLVSHLQASSPSGAQAVQATLGPGKTDYDQLYREALKTTAFANNDAAAALAAYLELGYQVVHNLKASNAIVASQERGLRAQAASILQQNARLRDPAAVAQLGEEMKLQTVVLLLGWQQSQTSGQESTFRTRIAQQFRQSYGLDMAQLKLTDQGFAKR